MVLLTTQQANKSRDEVLGQRIATLFGKPAAQEDAGLVSQRTILPELDFRLLLLKGKGGVWLVVADFLVPESFVLAAVLLGLVTMFQ